MLLGELTPDSGSLEWGSRVDVGYLAQQEEPDNPKATVLQYFREKAGVEEGEARGILARYLFYGAAVFRSVGHCPEGMDTIETRAAHPSEAEPAASG